MKRHAIFLSLYIFLSFQCIGQDEKIIIQDEGSYIDNFSEGKACVKINDKAGYINRNGEYFITPQFEYATSFHKGTAIVKKDGKFGIITIEGSFLVPLEYENIDFTGESFIIQSNKKYGLFDINGKCLIIPQYDKYDQVADKIIFSYKKQSEKQNDYHFPNCPKEVIIFDLMGKKIQTTNLSEYDKVSFPKCGGVVIVKKDGLSGLIDFKGNILLEPQYERIDFEYTEYAFISKAGKKGLINKDGEIILPLTDDKFEVFQKEKRLLISRHGKTALYNFELKRLSTEFGVIHPYSFDDSILPIETENGLLHLNKDGKIIKKFDKKYSYVSPFINGLADFRLKGSDTFGIMNTMMKIVVPPIYHFIFVDNDFIFVESLEGMQSFGLYNLDGKVLLPCKFQKIGGLDYQLFSEGLCAVTECSEEGVMTKMGYIDKKGKFILIFDFNTMTFKKNNTVIKTQEEEHDKQPPK